MAQKQRKYEKGVQGTGGEAGQGNRCRKGGGVKNKLCKWKYRIRLAV